MTRDGHLVVRHDLHLHHPRLGRREVPSLTLEELREVDVGGGVGIPTLEEVLELACDRSIPILPELKNPAPYRKR